MRQGVLSRDAGRLPAAGQGTPRNQRLADPAPVTSGRRFRCVERAPNRCRGNAFRHVAPRNPRRCGHSRRSGAGVEVSKPLGPPLRQNCAFASTRRRHGAILRAVAGVSGHRARFDKASTASTEYVSKFRFLYCHAEIYVVVVDTLSKPVEIDNGPRRRIPCTGRLKAVGPGPISVTLLQRCIPSATIVPDVTFR